MREMSGGRFSVDFWNGKESVGMGIVGTVLTRGMPNRLLAVAKREAKIEPFFLHRVK